MVKINMGDKKMKEILFIAIAAFQLLRVKRMAEEIKETEEEISRREEINNDHPNALIYDKSELKRDKVICLIFKNLGRILVIGYIIGIALCVRRLLKN